MNEPHRHTSHPAVINRLKRAGGHLQKVISMIEAGEPCLDIAQQLQAVESAISSAKTTLINDHLDHCLDTVIDTMEPARRKEMEDFKLIAKYL